MIHPERDPSYKTYLLQLGLKSLGFDPGEPDNWYGAKTDVAYKAFLKSLYPPQFSIKASSFADPMDVAAFNACKRLGHSDEYCFAFGDNGIGFTGINCATFDPICALPYEDWMEKWKSAQVASGKPVIVTYKGQIVQGIMGDTMPHRENIKNGAGIDLNPGFAKAFSLHPPFLLDGFTWSWA